MTVPSRYRSPPVVASGSPKRVLNGNSAGAEAVPGVEDPGWTGRDRPAVGSNPSVSKPCGRVSSG